MKKKNFGLWICHNCKTERGYLETSVAKGKAYAYEPGIIIQALLVYCNDNEECIEATKIKKKQDVLKDF